MKGTSPGKEDWAPHRSPLGDGANAAILGPLSGLKLLLESNFSEVSYTAQSLSLLHILRQFWENDHQPQAPPTGG